MFVKFTLPKGSKVGNYFGDTRSIHSDRSPFIFNLHKFGDVTTVDETEGRMLYVNLATCLFYDAKGRYITFSSKSLSVEFGSPAEAAGSAALIERGLSDGVGLCVIPTPAQAAIFLVTD